MLAKYYAGFSYTRLCGEVTWLTVSIKDALLTTSSLWHVLRVVAEPNVLVYNTPHSADENQNIRLYCVRSKRQVIFQSMSQSPLVRHKLYYQLQQTGPHRKGKKCVWKKTGCCRFYLNVCLSAWITDINSFANRKKIRKKTWTNTNCPTRWGFGSVQVQRPVGSSGPGAQATTSCKWP